MDFFCFRFSDQDGLLERRKAMRDTTILSITTDHYDDWLPLWQGYQDFYKVDLCERTPSLWQELINGDTITPFGFIAYQGDVAMGIAHASYYVATWYDNKDCFLHDLFIAPNARGLGIGRKLITHLYDVAAKNNAKRVVWRTAEDNDTAKKLYDSLASKMSFDTYAHNL